MVEERIINNAERIVILEHKVKTLEDTISAMDAKLDSLLHLQAKGQGAFWVASALFGTGLLGLGTLVLNWFRGG